MAITNTFFQLPARRLYTWKSPQDAPGHIVRNQIDYIMIDRRFMNAITSMKAYPEKIYGSKENQKKILDDRPHIRYDGGEKNFKRSTSIQEDK